MKPERLLNLIGDADEKFILEAMPEYENAVTGAGGKKESGRGKIILIVSAAASLLIAVSASLNSSFHVNSGGPEAEIPAGFVTEKESFSEYVQTASLPAQSYESGSTEPVVSEVYTEYITPETADTETVQTYRTESFYQEIITRKPEESAQKITAEETVPAELTYESETSEVRLTAPDVPQMGIVVNTIVPDIQPVPEPLTAAQTGVTAPVPDMPGNSGDTENIYEYAVYQGKLYRRSEYVILGAVNVMSHGTAYFKTSAEGAEQVKKDVLIRTENHGNEVFVYLKCENEEGYYEYTEMNGGNDYEI